MASITKDPRALARESVRSAEIAAHAFAGCPLSRLGVTENPRADLSDFRHFCLDPEKAVRRSLAENATQEDILCFLAMDPAAGVRAAVAANRYAPDRVIYLLKDDGNVLVRAAAAITLFRKKRRYEHGDKQRLRCVSDLSGGHRHICKV